MLLPQEITSTLATGFVETVYNISVVDLNRDQTDYDFSDNGRDLSSHDSCQLFELVDDDVEMGLESFSTGGIFSDGVLGHHSPDDL